MMRRLIGVLALSILVPAVRVTAQSEDVLRFQPGTCVRASEMPLMQLDVRAKGDLRAYFRRVNTTDWCSVDGRNMGPLSTVALPRFDAGDDIEYYFVLLSGKRVIAKSPQIYRARVTETCEAFFARHLIDFSVECGTHPAVANSLAAGYAVRPSSVSDPGPYISPDRPADQSSPH